MRNDTAEYDVSLSVKARRILTLEQHSLEECLEQVFGPSAALLGEYAARQQPHQLTCMHSLAYHRRLGITSSYAEVDFVLPNGQTLYLIHVFGKQEAERLWDQFTRTDVVERGEPYENPHGYFVPVKDKKITSSSCERAVRVYCENRCPQLAQLSITWLDDDTACELYERIWDTARLSE